MDADRSKNRPTNDKVAETISTYNALQTRLSQVSYRNTEAVEAYLVAHPEIEPFLAKAWSALVRYFGQHVEIVLEVMSYPDEAAEVDLALQLQS